MISFDHHELDALSVEMPKLGIKGSKVMSDVLEQGADDLRDAWRHNAEQTSGKHGRHYPKSIEANRVVSTDLVFEVGPNPAKPQGGMSFEFGSTNQPAHLDGQIAANDVIPRIQRRIEMTLFGAFGLGK